MIGMTHPAVGREALQRRSVLWGIFNLYLPCFDYLVILLQNPATTLHCYTDSQLGAQPQSLTVTTNKTHSCVYVQRSRANSPQ